MGRRSMIELPYVNAFTDRHGHRRHYFRKGSKRATLPGIPGSREFMEAYAAALGDATPAKKATASAPDGSFARLAALYYGSPKYRALAESSRMNYRRVIDRFNEQHGHRLVKQITREKIDAIIGGMVDRPGAAQVLLKRLRTLLNYAISIKWIPFDPSAGAESFESGEFHTWTEEEIAQFEARWPAGTKQRLAFALLLYTGQRGSDVRKMVWSDIAGTAIRVVQKKTGAKLAIALHPALSSILAGTRRQHVAILATAYGRPFSPKGFQNYISGAITAAGLPAECKAHGLRKAAARRLAEAGCTANEIGAVTGHQTLAEIERYTRAASQEKMAKQALAKQIEAESVPTPSEPSDNPVAKRLIRNGFRE